MDLREPTEGSPPEDATEATGTGASKLAGRPWFDGRGRTFRAIELEIERAARSDEPVLLRGETGTGKALAARAIHEMSARAARPFVAVDDRKTPSRPEPLPSALREAAGGTVFVEGVEALDESSRAVLFRTLETRGRGDAPRIVVALTEGPASGEPGQDLIGRFRVTISMPPLRERREDIPRLARRFLAEASAEIGGPTRELSPAALETLKRYGWPGNVGELATAIRGAAEASRGSRTIEPEHLPEAVRRATPSLEATAIPIGTTLEEAERAIVLRTVEATGGNMKKAARLLGISRSALYDKLERLEVEPASFRRRLDR